MLSLKLKRNYLYSLLNQKPKTPKSTHVQTDTIRQTDGPLVPIVQLVPIETDVIPISLIE